MSSEAAAASGPAASVIALDEGNDLLSVLALAHAQHGLRHSDFGRYRFAATRGECLRLYPGADAARQALLRAPAAPPPQGAGPDARHAEGPLRATPAGRCRRDGRAVRAAASCPSPVASTSLLTTAPPAARSHLLLPLFAAERTWALSQELSNAARDAGGGGPAHRQRGHAVKRLAKAAAWGRALAALAASRADARTALAAASYSSWLVRARLSS